MADITTIYRNIDVDESEDQVKEGKGKIYWIEAANLHSADLFLKIYDGTAASVVVGTTVPVMTIPIQETNRASITAPGGIHFSNGITVAATTAIADNDTGAPGANLVVINMGYS